MNIDTIFRSLTKSQQERAVRDYVVSLITGQPATDEHPAAADIRALPDQPTLDALADALNRGGVSDSRLPSMARDALADLVGPALNVVATQYPKPAHRAFCHLLRVPNYRPQSFIQGLDGLDVESVPEGGSFRVQSGFDGHVETAALERFGKIVQLSRQTVANDSQSRFYADVGKALVAAAYRAEARAVFGLMESGASLGDGQPWLDPTNTVSGASFEVALAAGFAAMAEQTLPNGEMADRVPRTLVLPPEWVIDGGSRLIDMEGLQVIRTGRASAAYLIAEPSPVGLMLLNDAPVVETDLKPKIALDVGLRLKVSHDFKAAPLSRNGIVKMTVSAP